jgi:hypothetical protein
MLQKLPNYEVVKFYGNFCGGGGGGEANKDKTLAIFVHKTSA